jgi:hypothetical protein
MSKVKTIKKHTNKIGEKRVFKVSEKTVHRCDICGGTDYTLSKHWPGTRYCAKCGPAMSVPNYEKMNDLRQAIVDINGAIIRMEFKGLVGLLGWETPNKIKEEDLMIEIDRLLVNVFNAYDNVFNEGLLTHDTDYHARVERSMKTAREVRQKIIGDPSNIIPFPGIRRVTHA